MTSQNAEIQALIDGIDEVLSKNTPRLPWVMSNDALQQRQVLEQARQYLESLRQAEADRLLQAATPPSLQPSPAQPGPASGQANTAQASAESAQQVLQAVLQEMNYWRVNMLQPLRTEIDSLQRQRELLSQEVRQLEMRQLETRQLEERQLEGRQQALRSSLQNQQLMEFLQAAMGQMQANLSGQVTQMIANLPAQSLSVSQSSQAALSAADLNLQSPAERMAQTQLTQSQSDQLMLKLDSTLQVIFESLNRNVQAYQESMEQGLDRMHHLGQQGEAMFTFLVNRLAQQLGQEASAFLQSGGEAANSTPDLPNVRSAQPQAGSDVPSNAPSGTPADAGPDSPFKVSDFLSQLPEPSSAASFVPAVPFNLSEEVLDIAGLDAADLPGNADTALAAEINQIDLAAIPALDSDPASGLTLDSVEPFDLFSGTQPLPATASSAAANLQTEVAPGHSDLDSALDLLNQLSAEMQAEAALGMGDVSEQDVQTQNVQTNVGADRGVDLAADLAADLTAAPVLARQPELIATPDALYDDAFYSSLGQAPAAALSASPSTSTAPDAADSAGSITLEQAWFGGLGDPAQSAASPAQAPTDSVGQSLDSFLLDSEVELAELSVQLPDLPLASETSDLAADLSPTVSDAPEGDFGQTLQALLEERAFEPMPISEAPNAAEVDLGMTLGALDGLGNPVEPPAVTIEGLEGLFEDLPDWSPNDAGQSQSIQSQGIQSQGIQSQAEAMADLFSQIGADSSANLDSALAAEAENPEKKNC